MFYMPLLLTLSNAVTYICVYATNEREASHTLTSGQACYWTKLVGFIDNLSGIHTDKDIPALNFNRLIQLNPTVSVISVKKNYTYCNRTNRFTWCDNVMISTRMVLKPKYSERTKSVPWLLMPWLLASPDFQQQCIDCRRTCRSFTRKDFKRMHQLIAETSDYKNADIFSCFMFPKK